MPTRKFPRKEQKPKEQDAVHFCRECRHVTPNTGFHTLTVHGKQPTLGECPYWEISKSVLLSQMACSHFKGK